VHVPTTADNNCQQSNMHVTPKRQHPRCSTTACSHTLPLLLSVPSPAEALDTLNSMIHFADCYVAYTKRCQHLLR
jgi:hypothetical protein